MRTLPNAVAGDRGTVLAVAKAHGIDVEDNFKTSYGTRPTSTHKSSMLQDFERDRPPEIDGILTSVQAFARPADVPTPTVDAVTALGSWREVLPTHWQFAWLDAVQSQVTWGGMIEGASVSVSYAVILFALAFRHFRVRDIVS